jgi:GT2 family glycosyltransferase
MRREKIAVFVVNYNMPERTNKIYQYLKLNVEYPIDIFIIDNGSDIVAPSIHTNVFIQKNVQTTGGWLRGLQEADKKGYDYLGYMFIITSMQFVPESLDPISSMVEAFDNPEVVGVHASLTKDSTTAWNHLKNRGLSELRRTWFIDNVCCIYRANWFSSIGRFDPELIYAYGIDLETCYKARRQGKLLMVDDRVQVEKISNIGYDMGRMNMTSEERQVKAMANMGEVFLKKYGANWCDELYYGGAISFLDDNE